MSVRASFESVGAVSVAYDDCVKRVVVAAGHLKYEMKKSLSGRAPLLRAL